MTDANALLTPQMRGRTSAPGCDPPVRQFYTLGDGRVSRMDVTPVEEPDFAP